MSQITKQGVLTIGSNIVFSVGNNKKYKTGLLNFNNPVAYSITIKKYSDNQDITTTLAELTLDPGDTVIDTSEYLLESRDKLIVNNTTGGTNYLAILNEVL